MLASGLFAGGLNDVDGLYHPDSAGVSTWVPSDFPNTEICAHRVNNMVLSVTNYGCFGSTDHWLDCETLESDISCEFPAGTQQMYLYIGALRVGAIVGQDTLVSAGYGLKDTGPRTFSEGLEMLPCSEPECGIVKKSNIRLDPNYDENTVSDLDMIAEYTDTLTYKDLRWQYLFWHTPLNLKVTQKSYSWGVDFAQDFILIDYDIQNIGETNLEDVFVGVLIRPRAQHLSRLTEGTGLYCGFRETYPSRIGRGYLDTIEIAWSADNDGDPGEGGHYDYRSVTGVTGLRVMQTPVKDLEVSFNWYTGWRDPSFTWGPMLESNKRIFATGGMGHPINDADKYYMMANRERDYDQIYAREWFGDEGWLPPIPGIGPLLTLGWHTDYVMSTGPFDLPAGESVPFTIGYIGGEGFHRSPDDYRNYMEHDYMPDEFYRRLDFGDLAENAVAAYWIYDNPGFDTDNDGFAGPYWEIVDTLPNGEIVFDRYYYAGDGVPDFRTATPPPPPVVRYNTRYGKVTLRWNGLVSESAIDPFTRVQDFEGYRVYIGKLNRLDNLGLVASHDFCDFLRFKWNEERAIWQGTENPFSLDSLRKIYGGDFDPELYPCASGGDGLVDGTDTYCFKPADWNLTIDGWDDGGTPGKQEFTKTYAEDIAAGLVTSEIDIEDTLTSNNWVKDVNPLTGDSVYYHKFYEYEFTMEDLLPSVPWWFSVTAFDFGDAFFGIGPLESSPIANSVEAWAISEASVVLEEDLKVIVYPNPYIGDGGYAGAGYEDPHRTGFIDHERRIHFLNLPPRCIIKIYTISGDYVRRLEHPGYYSDSDSKLTWNVRSKNNEMVTSGIYVYCVESERGNQIGKIVIIM
jgi:hypothetical protein